MKTMKVILLAGMMFFPFAVTAAPIIVGTADSRNLAPFGSTFGWIPTYQQTYGAGEFVDPFWIDSLSFYRELDDQPWDLTPQGEYSISLSTTNAGVDALSSNPADNWGADNTLVFQDSLPETVSLGGQMDLFLEQSFYYDPGLGNLLMTVTATDLSPTTVISFDTSRSSNDGMSRVYGDGFSDSIGLVTGFNDAGSTAVSTPATMQLFALGLGALFLINRSRKQPALIRA